MHTAAVHRCSLLCNAAEESSLGGRLIYYIESSSTMILLSAVMLQSRIQGEPYLLQNLSVLLLLLPVEYWVMLQRRIHFG